MVAIASRARSTFAILAAVGVTLGAALAMRPAAPEAAALPGVREYADDGFQIRAELAGDGVDVAIAAPAARPLVRPPLSVVVAIDRSRSMTGESIAQARRAASRLVSQLDAGDAFAIVAYSDAESTVVPMMAATAAHQALAERAIEELALDNGTCVSCGLALAGQWLARTPTAIGPRRIVLISDGRPNLGLRDPDDLAQLAADIAARGASISTVGVGDDFDAPVMQRIAAVGRGNYHHAPAAGALADAFDRELASLAATIATDVELTLELPSGASAESPIRLRLADFAAGETRTVALRRGVALPAAAAVQQGAIVRLSWRRAIDGAGRGGLALVQRPE